ncbi:TauD/TfdA family dioxygenase [Streptomyces globisporus]|uniref:TauD/TfdA family dioxygenase n=1 Tax=Streptomyces TaxID=1883 RepID=UPI00067DC3DA|nr:MULTISPECIES: TauD/TfdA family dioxygenase [Streptomyces]WSF77463.1 TauD/TfdA family dioxygenase [Streptomyces globisporus]WSQ92584.1 TauD/TfdA family dioxygenase [Streptomyces globisporus]
MTTTTPLPGPTVRAEYLPQVYEAPAPGIPVAEFIESNRPAIRAALHSRGAVLLRGFDVAGVDGFNGSVHALSGTPPLTYAERSSPRSTIKGQVYTSTDYPADEEIFLHNENSYQAVWPQALYFYCIEPAHTLGATPLADIRQVFRAIDPDVREEFTRRRWRVVRNFHEDFGVPWQQAFNTDDRAAVTAYCEGKGLGVEWTAGGLRTTAIRDAVHRHPVTGEDVWFNHITFFHVSTVAPDVREGLQEIFADEDLPTNSYYGDGAPIPDDVVAHLRQCYRDASTRFDWQRHDILVVDNMLAAHAREPFTGPRRIAVAMAEPSQPAAG